MTNDDDLNQMAMPGKAVRCSGRDANSACRQDVCNNIRIGRHRHMRPVLLNSAEWKQNTTTFSDQCPDRWITQIGE
jgi:hypothetical protein